MNRLHLVAPRCHLWCSASCSMSGSALHHWTLLPPPPPWSCPFLSCLLSVGSCLCPCPPCLFGSRPCRSSPLGWSWCFRWPPVSWSTRCTPRSRTSCSGVYGWWLRISWGSACISGLPCLESRTWHSWSSPGFPYPPRLCSDSPWCGSSRPAFQDS